MLYRWWMDLQEQLKETEDDSRTGGATDVGRTEGTSTAMDVGRTGGAERPGKAGRLCVGEGSRISEDAILDGNIVIGSHCMIGNGVVLRGNVVIRDYVRIGYGTEIKNSVIGEHCTIGPLCYVGDSLMERGAYLGALVRTSNHRLDRKTVTSWNGEAFEDTGLEKLGAHIGHDASLGINVVILPGRVVPPDSLFGPHIIIARNYPAGVYKLEQHISKTDGD